jgi:hypothetical protein
MDLVDGHVNVLVVFVVVAGRDVLVTGEPQSLHQVFHNTSEVVGTETTVFRM